MAIEKFAFPTTIHFGAGARKLVAEHLPRPGRQASAASSPIAASPRCRLLAEFVGELPGLDVAVFSGISAIPSRKQVMAGAAAYKAHRADAVIGLGGGAALDVAKAIALMADASRRRPRVRVGPPAGASDGPGDARLHRAAHDRGHRLRSRTLVRDLGRRDAREEDHLLAAAARQGRVRRSRAHARPAVAHHRGHRHGRADAQRRVVPVARVPPAVRRHRARRRAHRGACAARSPCATATTSPRARTC